MLEFTLARLVRLAAAVVVGIIALAIIFVALDASSSNGIVSTVNEWAGTLTSPFHHVFAVSSHKGTIALNYGLAIVVYLVLAAIVAGFLARATVAGRQPLPY